MGRFTNAVKQGITELLNPGYSARQAEADYLRQVYRDNANVVIRRNQWYRLVHETGALFGFEYVCACGLSYKLLDFNLFTQPHDCPTCKNRFDLFKAVGVTKDIPQSEWPRLFSQLPMRPSAVAKSSSPFMDTWSNKSDAVEYEPHDLKFT